MSFGIKIKSVNITPSKILAKHGLGGDNKARKYLATSVAKYCDPYVPMSAGAGAHLKNQKQIAPDGSKAERQRAIQSERSTTTARRCEVKNGISVCLQTAGAISKETSPLM